jgi:cytochrome c-type biogenesis protein CcmF
LGWRHTSVDAFRKQFTWPLIGALLTAVAAAFVNRNPYPIVGLAVCGFVAATILQEYVRGVRARQTANGENALVAMGNLYRRNGRRYGGYLVHLAIVMIGVAVVGNEFYQQTTHVTLDKGQGVEIAGYELVYTDLVVTEAANRLEFTTPIMVYDADSGALLSTLRPQRNVYHKNPEAPTSEVGLRMTLTEDVYVLLNGWEDGATSATFTIYINPLTAWMWIGGVVLVIGTLIAAWPHPVRRNLSNEALYGAPAGAHF